MKTVGGTTPTGLLIPAPTHLFKWMIRLPHKIKHDTSNRSDSGVPPAKKERHSDKHQEYQKFQSAYPTCF